MARLQLGTGQGSVLPPPSASQGWAQPAAPVPAANAGLLSALHATVHGGAIPPDPRPSSNSTSPSVIRATLLALMQPGVSPAVGSAAFWSYVTGLAQAGLVDQRTMLILEAFGYTGAATTVIPDPQALSEALGRPLPPAAAAAPQNLANARTMTGAAEDAYTARLPESHRRAAPEIYSSMRSEGTASARQWLKDNYQGYKGAGSQWVDLWSQASQIDFMIAKCATDAEIMQLLQTDDLLEIMLRHLGAFFYESRTKDRTGAAMMRAVATPGFGRDVVPQWLVADATTFSKAEYQRSERVRGEMRQRTQEDKGNNNDEKKGKGKGKNK